MESVPVNSGQAGSSIDHQRANKTERYVAKSFDVTMLPRPCVGDPATIISVSTDDRNLSTRRRKFLGSEFK